MGGPTAYLRGMYQGDGIQERGEVARAMVEIGGCGTALKARLNDI